MSGATGLLGRRLLRALERQGTLVRALTRRPDKAAEDLDRQARLVGWDGTRFTPDHLAGATAVVHLAGEPIFGGRLTAARRARIRSSRIESTRSLAVALAELDEGSRPRALVSASAVGFYGSRGDERLEEDAPSGDGFLAEVCHEWEAAAREAERSGLRVVMLRFGVVLAREGGALALMARPFRLGLGGRLGDGRQWFPWIHADDAVGLVCAALGDGAYRGPVNAVAPEPVRNAELTQALARVLGRPARLPVPALLLRLALGDLAGELLGSRRVVPARALERGYRFEHPGLEGALAAELGPGAGERSP